MTATQTLRDFSLRHTSNRQEVLDLFLQTDHALSHSDIENGLGPDHDRVTIYRTLKTFLEKGILHKVLDDEGGTKYALCRTTCAQNDHHHDHVHFKCEQCGQTTCLDDVIIPALSLPSGYRRKEINLLVQGVCSECNQ
ncbi:transcriptional regulator [Nibrella viscosa]|uniref:Transcriptional regulator n=1 Tax=Nibrella viscosa TaxID=1084524 RepID=A0ABP8KLK8_9BACT